MVKEYMTNKIVVQCHGSKKIVFWWWYNFLFEQINHLRTAVHGTWSAPIVFEV